MDRYVDFPENARLMAEEIFRRHFFKVLLNVKITQWLKLACAFFRALIRGIRVCTLVLKFKKNSRKLSYVYYRSYFCKECSGSVVLIDFWLTVKAATQIFISGRGSAISSSKQGNQVLFIIW